MQKRFNLLGIFWAFLFLPLTAQVDTAAINKGKDLLEESYNYIVHTGDYRQAIEVSEQARLIFEEQLGPYDTLVAEAYLNIAEANFYLENYRAAIDNFLKEGLVYKQKDDVKPSDLASNFNNLGMCHEYIGDYEKAFSFYEQSIPLFKISKNKSAAKNLAFTYNNVAICYNRTHNYHKALQYLEKGLQAEKEIFGEDNLDIASTYNNIGLTYKALGQYDKSLELLLKALELRETFKDNNTYRVARLHGNIGMSYYKSGQYENAVLYCEKDLNLKLQKTNDQDLVIATPLVNIGKCHREAGDYITARTYIEKALQLRERDLDSLNRQVLDTHLEMAKLECKEGKELAAIARMEQLIRRMIGKNNPTDFDAVQNPMKYFKALLQKGDAHLSLYYKTQNIQQLHQSLNAYEPALDLIDFIRTGIDEKDSKEILLQEHYSLYAKAMEIYYQLWQKNKDKQYALKAFDTSERGKSAVLLETVKTTHAKNFAGIPADLLEKERRLKVDIAYTEKLRFEAIADNNTAQKNELSNQLFDLKEDYDRLLDKFKKDYASYFQLKYNTQNSSVQNIQDQLLDEQSSLLTYFVNAQDLYILVLNKDEIHFFKENLTDVSLEGLVKDFINSIADYPNVQLEERAALEEIYIQNAFSLYQKLIQPVEKYLKEKLIIIPHELLGYVPFECLLKSKPEKSFAFRSHDYLIKDYQMSYSYSANLLYEMQQAEATTASKQWIGFAPSFSKEAADFRRVRLNGLGALTMNGPELDMISAIISGDVFKGEAATEDNFVQKASDYQIIHLATHGIANDQSGDFCYLAFTEQQDSIENEVLYVKELYPLSLKADMVVLSACETARGELQKGEGIVSLARGFSYAGAKSIITTLWSINDKTTAELMESFYKNIKKGNRKDVALREAQLAFIDNNRDQVAHPVYWAAFIPVGNMEAIDLGGISSLALLGIGLLVGCLLFGIWRFRNT